MNNDEQDKNQPLPNPNDYFQPNPNVRNDDISQQPQPAYNQYIDPKKPRSVKKIIIIAVSIALVFFAGLIALVLLSDNKNDPNNSQTTDQSNLQVNIPQDWEALQTDLGFSVKAPKDWFSSSESSATTGLIEATSLSLRNFDENDDGAEDQQYISVILSAQRRSDSATKEDFEQAVTTIDDESRATYEELGITESQTKISNSKISINGQEWLQVDTEIPEQISRTIYRWVDGYSVALTVYGDDQAELDSIVKDYLLPMAASVEIK